ncbi:MAG TPA: phage holin family protein [Fimbriimonadaceae bacterium]|nr:phage holin family protein [Fimbriimonadaceae bacterium]HRE93109.1 phage holin family protein [Fimbriimonadaceae bacterium]HRI75330.1 phage holin family protein [Fimbriimonadaceae bacterium]
MGKFFLRWVILVAALIGAATATGAIMTAMGWQSGFRVELVPVNPTTILQLFLGAGLLALVSAVLGPILKLMTLPLNCMTLGLFTLIINAGLFMLVGSWGIGFVVENFGSALLGSIIFAAINGILEKLFVKDDDKRD